MDKYSMKMFQENLKRLREFSNLTQNELANELFIARSAVSNYENGNREPTLLRLQQIANYFKVSVSYLIGDDSIEDEINEINGNNLLLSKYISKDGRLDISELSIVNRIVLVEYFRFLLLSQRNKDSFRKKLEDK